MQRALLTRKTRSRRRAERPLAGLAAVFSFLGAVVVAAALATTPTPAAAQALDTQARNAVVIDADTGAVLLEKEADAAIPPASMSKLMTAAMAFEALQQGRLSLDDRFSVSRAAFRKEGSTMFLNLTDRPRVEDLLRGVIIQSGNDACIALAEALAGSERAFAQRMNVRARELGMTQSSFVNATGLPHPDHRMSVRDLSIVARYIIDAFPEYYGYYSETSFEWAGVEQPNRNPLLYLRGLGGDGMKTGYTEEAGYGLVGSAVQEGRRVIAVIAGLSSIAARSREMERIISWAFREFKNDVLGVEGDIVAEADVWLGERATVPLALANDLVVTTSWQSADDVTATLIYEGPIAAPIAAGQEIGVLRVSSPGLGATETTLVAAEAVAEGGYFTRLMAGVGLLVDRLVDEIRG